MTTAMNATNQTFDWSRFKATLRKEWSRNGRKMLLVLAAIYLFLTFSFITKNLDSRGMAWSNAIDPMYVFMLIAILASLGFAGLNGKRTRMEYLTSPSSMAEKFTANTLIYVIGVIAAVCLCIGLADLTRVAVLWPFRGDSLLVTGPTTFADTVIKWVKPRGEFWSCLPKFMLNCLWYASLFMLGSILWPKNTIAKTALVMIAYWAVMAYMQDHFVWSNEMTSEAVEKDLNSKTDMLGQILLIIDSLFIILCWVAGWFLFRDKDLVTRRWLK